LYLTQLTIQVCVADNRFKNPSSKRLYFILETERASRERHECNQYGYDYIFGSNRGIAQSLFPLIGYFSRIFNRPVWELRDVSCSEYLSKINEFNYELSKLFGEELNEEVSVIDAINSGGNFQKQIFEETLSYSKKGSRKTANKKVVDIFEKVFSGGFISDRKAAGKYFVLNSNVLLLITNLIIEQSANKKLLIDDVIEGFKERGIWLDLKSKRALLQFYENVGNIEKLSDSGDAVYVKSTI
jgi:DNA phosphorothioation-dependent restriction protein DptG